MALRKIFKQGDDILNKKCREVLEFNPRLWELLDDMKQTLAAASGAGIAAPQVGVMRRAAIVLLENEKMLEIVNPEIVQEEGEVDDAEGCLSVPGVYGMVKRPQKVQIKAQDRHGKWFVMTATDFTARAFCHEIDHLNGILFTTLVSEYLEPDSIK